MGEGELSVHSLFLLAQTGRSFSGDRAAWTDAQVLSLEGLGSGAVTVVLSGWARHPGIGRLVMCPTALLVEEEDMG